ncbi:hypothetical protein LXM50_09650 [Microbacterium sp. Au-Mic1]|uniref:hypothetical protein n=1 Tax=Microbacterium sp. Au-Mic1 TaxID=2906457 RepID=UPI001E2AEE37|nr:hypothetical protein [Microbacterium sp. Au-Mic1]MCE4026239.1 hypothetical protein [Microbacterium sp. Au-Mic1]
MTTTQKETAPRSLTRRTVLMAGLGGVLAAATVATTGPSALATTRLPMGPPATRVTEIGPGIVQYSLMSGVTAGGVTYVGSRNLEPAGIIALDHTTGRVAHSTSLAAGYSIQALALDEKRGILYAGVLQKATGPQPNLYRWRLSALDAPAEPIGRIGDRDVRDLAVAPDGTVFAVGGGSSGAPALWQFDPTSGAVTNLGVPAPTATLARAVAATDAFVYFGAGSSLGGGGSASRAALYAYDRVERTFADITPATMLGDPSMRELAIAGDRLLASTAGAADPTKLAEISLADHSVTALITSIGKTAKCFATIGDQVFCANETGIIAWTPSTGDLSQVDLGSLDLGEIWGLDAQGDDLVAVSGFGFVADIAASGALVATTDLGEAGAPASAQTCMGIAVGAGFAYVGGNGGIARHDLTAGTVQNLRIPGESKDGDVVDGVLYVGQYSGQGIWSYDPRSGAPIRQVAKVPEAQNRPLDTDWDATNGLLLVAAQDDTQGGGSIWTYDPATGASTVDVNPIDAVQLVRAVATVDGVAYLGGDNAQKTGARGTIVAWDPVARAELWRLETGAANGIAALETKGRYLFALTIKGALFVIDRPTRTIVHTSDQSAICPGFAALKEARGVVYGVSDTTLFRIHPRTFAVTVVVAGINGGWYSGPHLNVDEDGVIYTLRDRTLVSVDDHPQR